LDGCREFARRDFDVEIEVTGRWSALDDYVIQVVEECTRSSTGTTSSHSAFASLQAGGGDISREDDECCDWSDDEKALVSFGSVDI